MADFMALTRSIADDPKIPPHLKPAYLTALEGTLTTQEGYVPLPKGVPPTIISTGFTLRRESDNRRISVAYGRRIIQAYKQDAPKASYRDWSELLAYLRYSAGACAGYTAEALGLDKSMVPAVEAIACAYALVVRMTTLRNDWTRTKKIYLPTRWLTEAGIDAAELSFDGAAAWPKVRDRGIAQVRQLIQQSAGLKLIGDRRLKLAFAWAKADISVRSDDLAAAAVYPVTELKPPSRARRLMKTMHIVFRHR
jgi:phytoene/squalene synthetase